MIVIGIDENGLGPVLGPMVVTACAFGTPSYAPELFWQLSDKDLPADDSKVVFKQNKHAWAESAVLKWLSLFGHVPKTATDLFSRICQLQPLPCPTNFPKVCRLKDEIPLPLFSANAPSARSLDLRNRFESAQISPVWVGSFSICPGQYNEAMATGGRNKLQYDFELMIRLIRIVEQQFPHDEILAICGKVGGTKNYRPWFEAINITPLTTLKEIPECSKYICGDRTTIAFIKDGDSAHLPVAVASMVGKYIREIHISEMNRLLAPNQKPVSGYRDPRTKSFIESTRLKRQKISLIDKCFLRNS